MQDLRSWIKTEMKAKNHIELSKYALAFGAWQSEKGKSEEARAGFKIKTMHHMCLVTLSC